MTTTTEITAPGIYTVRFGESRLSPKRWKDAQKLVKELDLYMDTSSTYDPAARAWTVSLPSHSESGLRDLRTLHDAYSATVEPATDATIDRAALIAERRQIVARLAEIDRLLDAES